MNNDTPSLLRGRALFGYRETEGFELISLTLKRNEMFSKNRTFIVKKTEKLKYFSMNIAKISNKSSIFAKNKIICQ